MSLQPQGQPAPGKGWKQLNYPDPPIGAGLPTKKPWDIFESTREEGSALEAGLFKPTDGFFNRGSPWKPFHQAKAVRPKLRISPPTSMKRSLKLPNISSELGLLIVLITSLFSAEEGVTQSFPTFPTTNRPTRRQQ
jgi:hypothetical protein